MNSSSYLKLSRHNVYIFRRRIPKCLLDFFITNELRISTKTSNKKTAIHIARKIANESDILFEQLKNNKNMTDEKDDFLELSKTIERWKETNYFKTRIEEEFDGRLQEIVNGKQEIKKLEIAQQQALIQQQATFKLAVEALSGLGFEKPALHGNASKIDYKLSELVEDFFSAESLETRGNAVATIRKNRDSLNLFIEIIGDKLISELAQPDAVKFAKACLLYGRKDGKKRAVSTVNGFMNSVSKFSSWVTSLHSETGHTKLDFSNLRYKSSSRPADERAAFSREEVIRILNHPKLVAFKEDEPIKFWLPYISAYSGARLEEITQLSPVNDIYVEDNVWIFDINKRDGKSVKNNAAIRRIPIHSELIKQGFLEYLETMKAAKEQTIFQGEKMRDGRTGKNAGKRVNRFIQKVVGIEIKSLHSFRHTFATNLKRAEVNGLIAAEIMGHKHGGISYDRYAKGFLSNTLKIAVEKIDFRL